MNTSKTLHYKDYSGTWHVCPLQFYQNAGVRGYTLPTTSAEIKIFFTRHKIFLARIDVPACWYIPDIAPNAAMLEQFVEQQKEAFELEVKAHWVE